MKTTSKEVSTPSTAAAKKENAAGNQAFRWIGSGAFTGVAGQLRYQVTASDTRILLDTDGDSTDGADADGTDADGTDA